MLAESLYEGDRVFLGDFCLDLEMIQEQTPKAADVLGGYADPVCFHQVHLLWQAFDQPIAQPPLLDVHLPPLAIAMVTLRVPSRFVTRS